MNFLPGTDVYLEGEKEEKTLRRMVADWHPGKQQLLLVILLLVLATNTLVLGRSLNLFRLPGETNDLAYAKQGAVALIDQIERSAEDQGLATLPTVLDLIARFQYDIKRARSLDELAQVLMNGGAEAKEILNMELDGKRRTMLEELINSDPNVSLVRDKISVSVSNDETLGLLIDDQSGILTEITSEQIRNNTLFSAPFAEIVIEVADGKARVVNYRTLYDRLLLLQKEVQKLQTDLHQVNQLAGFSAVSGAGVTVEVFDAPGGYTNDYIVHDADIRDIVNELYSAGAIGVSVGGVRLTANWSIRCAGSVVLVNQQQIEVNPVLIEAVGNSSVLRSSLDLIANTYRAVRGIELTVNSKDVITLSASSKTP